MAHATKTGGINRLCKYPKNRGKLTNCPLTYTSNNASDKREVLATLVLSILAGHHRYAHITAMRNDGIHPELILETAVENEVYSQVVEQ